MYIHPTCLSSIIDLISRFVKNMDTDEKGNLKKEKINFKKIVRKYYKTVLI